MLGAARAALHLLLEIEARRERRAGAAHDQRADVGILFGRVERLVDLDEHRVVERIGALGAIKRQPRDVVELFK